MEKIIKLSDFLDPRITALVGRPNGERLLKKFKEKNIIFIDIEKNYKKISIIFPERVITINKSFFLGFLETRVQALGKEGFIEKYEFDSSEHINNRIVKYIDSSLLSASPGEILDVWGKPGNIFIDYSNYYPNNYNYFCYY